MRIIVCNSQVPFEHGGAEILADALVTQLRARGHQAELVTVPLRWYPGEEILKSYLSWRLANLDESEGRPIDRVIALKFPAYAVRHAHKITWLVQQLRQAYDLLGTEHSYLNASLADAELVRHIRRMDSTTIGESQHVFAISTNVGNRLQRYNGLSAETLYPPPALETHLRHERYGDYVLYLGRLNRLKRVEGLIEALSQTRTGVRAIIAGRGEELESLERLARKRGVAQRIEFAGYVSDEDALGLYANALGVYYAPLDEDYGLATVEAMKARKPVFTTSDSGGVLEFVRDGSTGYVTDPGDAGAMAQRIDELYSQRALAARLGAAGAELVRPITWERAIERLLDA